MKDTLVFIDAGFLSKLSKYFGNGKYLIYDIVKFAEYISKNQGFICNHIFFYTAPPFQSESPTRDESERFKRYEQFKERLARNKLISIREGRCQRVKFDSKFIYKQKGVDALAIIDFMSIPLQFKEIHEIILIANDSDFVPVVEKLKTFGISIILFTYFSKNRKSSFSRSNELLKSVSRYVRISKEDFDNAALEKRGRDELQNT